MSSCSNLPAGSRLSDSVILLPLWEKHELSSEEKFDTKIFSNSLKETVFKYTSRYKLSQRARPTPQGKVHKSSLELLLNESASKALKAKLEVQAQSTTSNTTQTTVQDTTQKKNSFFDRFKWSKPTLNTDNNIPTLDTDNEPTLATDWLDFAYKSSIDEESLFNDMCYVYDTLKDFIDRMSTAEAKHKVILSTGKVAIIDYSNASLDDLHFLMQLFTGCSVREAKEYRIAGNFWR